LSIAHLPSVEREKYNSTGEKIYFFWEFQVFLRVIKYLLAPAAAYMEAAGAFHMARIDAPAPIRP
jgi:hypothetical protein